LYGVVGYKFSGIGLWPAVLIHVLVAAWCIEYIQQKQVTNLQTIIKKI